MDLSGLIFVALALAWAAYLIPKALKHSDEAGRSRTISTFSSSMRVLDRSSRSAAGASSSSSSSESSASSPAGGEVLVEEVELTEAQQRRRRQAAKVATRRRRNVLGLLLAVLGAVALTCAFSVIAWAWIAAPVGLLMAWLVACRVMVKRERAPMVRRVPVAEVAEPDAESEVDDDTSTVAAVDPADPDLWEPRQVPLPTYVNKARAPRAASRAIDFDDSGVWTSGHSTADSEIARTADEARAEDTNPRSRAVGS